MQKASNEQKMSFKQVLQGVAAASLLSVSLTPVVNAAEYTEPNDPRFTDPGLPTRGIHMSRVSKKWGQPSSKKAAVGKPPISSWRYDGFNVYFEHSLVITSVSDGDVSSAYTR